MSKEVDEIARRGFNLLAAALGLLVLAPVLLVVCVAIRLDSPGPVIFKQTRIGKYGKPFRIWKFRSMKVDADRAGGQLTVGADPRITPVGAAIRAWKIDELPQLVNVVMGDMDLVGPRPEVPRYVELYSPTQRRVLDARPGITDPASVEFRNESELMSEQSDPQSYYINVLMPRKLELNLEYLSDRSLATDITVILRTFAAVVRRSG